MVSSYHANHELTIGILSVKILYNTNRFLQPVKPVSDSPYRLDDLRIPHIHIVISFPVVEIWTAPSGFFLYIHLFIVYIFLFFICIPDLFHIFKIILFFSEFLLTFCIL